MKPFDVNEARALAHRVRMGRELLNAVELSDQLLDACEEVEQLRMAKDRNLVKRLREERDNLRNEVVRLRGGRNHDYVALEDTPLGDAMRFRCRRCGKVTTTPTHAYFDPCVSQIPLQFQQE